VYVNQTNLNGKLRKKLEPSKNLGVAWPAQSPPLRIPLVQIKVTTTNHEFGPDYKLH